jgi:dTDP-D-glucose 4,6-dehydratase
MQIRDWLFVEDRCQPILTLLERKNVTARSTTLAAAARFPTRPWWNKILAITCPARSSTSPDQPGHDRRYALSGEKLSQVDWYRPNPEWIAHVRSGEMSTTTRITPIAIKSLERFHKAEQNERRVSLTRYGLELC